MRLRYSPSAIRELDELLSYIADRSTSDRVARRIQKVAATISEQPFAGRLTSDHKARLMNTHPYPYLVFYEINDNDILILAIQHGAQNPSGMPGQG